MVCGTVLAGGGRFCYQIVKVADSSLSGLADVALHLRATARVGHSSHVEFGLHLVEIALLADGTGRTSLSEVASQPNHDLPIRISGVWLRCKFLGRFTGTLIMPLYHAIHILDFEKFCDAPGL